MFRTLPQDRAYLENKYHRTDEPFDPYRRMEYHGYEYDPATGFSDEEMAAGLRAMEPELETMSHPIAKATAVAYVLDHTRIDVNAQDYFVGIYAWNRAIKDVTVLKWRSEVMQRVGAAPEIKILKDANAADMWPDFDHVVPDWDSLLRLGFPGLLERVRKYRKMHEASAPLTQKESGFFASMEIELEAVLRLLDRLCRYAESQTHEKAPVIAKCLARLRDGAPQTFYEALQEMYLYFILCECVDYYQTRSLGNGLDRTLLPFWEKDLASGADREELGEYLAYFFMQFSAIGNYWGHPFYLAGTGENGESLVNDLTYEILRIYDELDIYNPKIQLKINENTPEKFLRTTLRMIRAGHSSMVYCCEPGYVRAIMRYGASFEQARDFDIRGCYETGVRCAEVSTGAIYLNTTKAVMLALNGGRDEKTGAQLGPITEPESATFAEFYAAFLTQWRSLIERTIRITDSYEGYLDEINPSVLYSATMERSLRLGIDAYCRGALFESSCVLNCGFASAVNSMQAVRELVYERKETTLPELRKALSEDWNGYELLRAKALRCRKYGCGENTVDILARGMSDYFTSLVNNRPNARGGVYKAECHTAMHFVRFGRKLGATPDGRKAGDELSKNASPVMGTDKNGPSALIASACSLTPSSYPEAFCLDLMLHPSAVSGEDGLDALEGLVRVYMARGGMAIQFNILRPDVLRDAQAHPEKYRNLQVRVCGWNVRWNDLSRAEQEAYIRRAEAVAP